MEISKDKLNVILVRTDFYGDLVDGGISALHRGMADAFHDVGHRFTYISGGKHFLGEHTEYINIEYKKILFNIPEVYNFPFSTNTIKVVLKAVERIKPDFFIQHNSIFNYAGTVIKKKTGLPFILHCDGVETWAKKNWGKKNFFSKSLELIEKLQWANADIINVPSEEVKKMMIEFGGESDKIIANPNGVNPSVFKPGIDCSNIIGKFNLPNKFVVSFVGSFGHWHGTEVLAESIKFLKNWIPNLMVLFVGDGLLRPKIEEIIIRDGVEDYAMITGLVPYSEVPVYMSAANVLTSPCINNEDGVEFFNSPIKLFEYMAMGKPVVASDVGQQGMVIEHNKNGLLCREKDPEELADAIYSLYKDPDLADRLGKQSRLDAVEKYDWKVYNQRIIDAYYKLRNRV